MTSGRLWFWVVFGLGLVGMVTQLAVVFIPPGTTMPTVAAGITGAYFGVVLVSGLALLGSGEAPKP